MNKTERTQKWMLRLTLIPIIAGVVATTLFFAQGGFGGGHGKFDGVVVTLMLPAVLLFAVLPLPSLSRVNGMERLRLTPPSLRVYLPRWSPDGTQLAFRAESASLPVKIYTVSADGKQLKQLFSDGRNEADPSWSPDGRKLAFGRTALPYESQPKAIHVYDFESGQTSTLPGSEGLFSPRWSPDGRYIAAMSLDSQRLMLFDWETEDWQELARVNASYPTWSLDSKTLYLGAKVNNRQGQYRINVAEKKLERMVSLPETFHEVVSFALWSGMDSSPVAAWHWSPVAHRPTG